MNIVFKAVVYILTMKISGIWGRKLNNEILKTSNTLWCNKHLGIEIKSGTYKTATRPIMNYTADTRPDTTKTKRQMEATHVKIMRWIIEQTFYDGEANETIKRQSNLEDINEWVLKERKEWKEHVDRIDITRLIRVARDNFSLGRRNIEHQRRYSYSIIFHDIFHNFCHNCIKIWYKYS